MRWRAAEVQPRLTPARLSFALFTRIVIENFPHLEDRCVASHSDLHAGRGAMFGEQVAIERIVRVAEEGLGAAIATLRHVVRDSGKDGAGEAGHCRMLWPELVGVK